MKCECCGLKEDCTQDYISEVKSKFDGKWLCGLLFHEGFYGVRGEREKERVSLRLGNAIISSMF